MSLRSASSFPTSDVHFAQVALEPLAVEVVLGQESARLLTVTLAYSVQHHKARAAAAVSLHELLSPICPMLCSPWVYEV